MYKYFISYYDNKNGYKNAIVEYYKNITDMEDILFIEEKLRFIDGHNADSSSSKQTIINFKKIVEE